MPNSSRMTILRPVPPEDQIAAYYRDAIDRSVIAHDERLPGRRALGQQWGVNKEVIRKAFAVLSVDGYVRADGSGTFAVGPERRNNAA